MRSVWLVNARRVVAKIGGLTDGIKQVSCRECLCEEQIPNALRFLGNHFTKFLIEDFVAKFPDQRVCIRKDLLGLQANCYLLSRGSLNVDIAAVPKAIRRFFDCIEAIDSNVKANGHPLRR